LRKASPVTAGTNVALLALAAVIVITAPLGIFLDRWRHVEHAGRKGPSLEAALTRAVRHRGYGLLTLGFFTCGFQLAFIATHLPNYLLLCHMPAGLGATALTLIGFFT